MSETAETIATLPPTPETGLTDAEAAARRAQGLGNSALQLPGGDEPLSRQFIGTVSRLPRLEKSRFCLSHFCAGSQHLRFGLGNSSRVLFLIDFGKHLTGGHHIVKIGI